MGRAGAARRELVRDARDGRRDGGATRGSTRGSSGLGTMYSALTSSPTSSAIAAAAGFEWAYSGGRLDVEEYDDARTSLQLSWWNDTECPGVIDLTVRRECIIDPQHVIETDRSDLRSVSRGYASVSTRTALLLWPGAISDEVRADAKPSWAIESALAALDAQGVPRAKRLLGLAARGVHEDDRIRSFRLEERHRFDSTEVSSVTF